MTAPALWLGSGATVLVLLILLRRPLRSLLRLFGRSAVALATLAALGLVPPLASILPGANAVNALVVGALGLPGFGLLMLLQWTLA